MTSKAYRLVDSKRVGVYGSFSTQQEAEIAGISAWSENPHRVISIVCDEKSGTVSQVADVSVERAGGRVELIDRLRSPEYHFPLEVAQLYRRA